MTTISFTNKLSSFSLRRRITISLIIWAVILCFAVITRTNTTRRKRELSIDFGNGNCKWTDAVESSSLKKDSLLGTLYASYPGSGIHVVLQQSEGLTGIKVGDENDIDQVRRNGGIVKTQYPHYEGTWSYGDAMDQVVMVIRNPRWALPSYYHSLMANNDRPSIEHDDPRIDNHTENLDNAHEELFDTFVSAVVDRERKERMAEVKQWMKWRDLRFETEINLWALQIDFYMGDGAQYWMDTDFERNGQMGPFRIEEHDDDYEEESSSLSDRDHEQKWPHDPHCVNDVTRSCYPVAVIVHELLNNPETGPSELTKLANVLRKDTNETDSDEMISPDAISCIYHETWINSLKYGKSGENDEYLPIEDLANHKFTIPQMQRLLYKVQEMRNKYSSDPRWINEPLAMDLVSAFDLYLDEILSEFNGIMMKANAKMPPIRSSGLAESSV